jgi:hypothetical protein
MNENREKIPFFARPGRPILTILPRLFNPRYNRCVFTTHLATFFATTAKDI